MSVPTLGSFAYTSNAPDGVVCGRIGNFILVSLASNEYTVQWHAINNILSWPTPATDAARAVQAGSEVLTSEYGKITAIIGSEFFGYVFQQSAITKFTYVGGDVVFRIDVLDTSRGCIDYNRVSRVDDTVFFESKYGYHAITSNEVQDIGLGAVDDSYRPVSVLAAEQNNVVANPGNDTVFWEGHNLAFNYKTAQWTRTPALSGITYFPLSSSSGVVGQIVYSGASVDIQDSMDGAPTTAVIVTPEAELNPSGRFVVNGIRPFSDGGTWTVRAGARNNLSESVSWTASASVNSRTGLADLRKEGRYLRGELTCSDGFNTAIGVDVEFSGSGRV